MNYRSGWVIAILVLAGLACSLSEVGLEPVEESPTPPPSPESTSAEASADPGPQSLSLENPALYALPPSIIASYRTSFRYRIEGIDEGGDFVQGAIMGTGVNLTDSRVSSFEVQAQDTDILSEVLPIEYVRLGGLTALSEPTEGCSTFAAGAGAIPLSALSDLSLLLRGNADRVEPDEDVNGVNALVFLLTEENIEPGVINLQEMKEGKLYVAETGRYVVKLTLEGTGSSELLTGDPEFIGQVSYELSYHDFGQPMEISPPIECIQVDSIQQGLDLPRLFDAFGEVTYPGITTYRTGFKYQESVLFYRGEMINAGWNLLDIVDDGVFALLTFSNDLFAVQIAIEQDPVTSDVVITVLQVES
jgi:hypothetical protein